MMKEPARRTIGGTLAALTPPWRLEAAVERGPSERDFVKRLVATVGEARRERPSIGAGDCNVTNRGTTFEADGGDAAAPAVAPCVESAAQQPHEPEAAAGLPPAPESRRSEFKREVKPRPVEFGAESATNLPTLAAVIARRGVPSARRGSSRLRARRHAEGRRADQQRVDLAIKV